MNPAQGENFPPTRFGSIRRRKHGPLVSKPTESVWTSGLATWKKLARAGVWVNGCAEGLSEEDPGLQQIVGRLDWLKLTHDGRETESSAMPTLAHV